MSKGMRHWPAFKARAKSAPVILGMLRSETMQCGSGSPRRKAARQSDADLNVLTIHPRDSSMNSVALSRISSSSTRNIFKTASAVSTAQTIDSGIERIFAATRHFEVADDPPATGRYNH